MRTFIFLIVTLVLSACALPEFSFKAGGKSGKEIPGKTIQIDYFESQAPLANANAGNFLTESLKNLMQSQTKLNLVTENGDWQIDGAITDYRVEPISIQANSESAAQNRFTMTVTANCKYVKPNKEDSVVFQNERFSFYSDFDSNEDFTSKEDELQKDVVGQITQAIYDKAFGGEW